MSLQTKFVLMVATLGLALAGSLAASWWAFAVLQRELATPFADTAGLLDTLREIKRETEQHAMILNAEGLDASVSTARPQGVRGPWGRPKAFAPTLAQREEFRVRSDRTIELLNRINSREEFTARIGVSTWRNLKGRLEEINELGERWFAGDVPAEAELPPQEQAARACYYVHELIEATEGQILRGAKSAVSHGQGVRSRLLVWLQSVFAVGLLGGLLAVALLRRWVQKPVRALRQAAARIAEGDLQHRVPVMQGDELGLLSAEVNHMAQMVQVMQDERVERERLAAVGVMLRRLVHNLRNPLAGIRGLAEVTRLDFTKGTAEHENMDLIVSTVDTFERWLSELLDATSPSSIHPRETAVETWLSGIVEMHRPQAQSRNVVLHSDAAAAPPTAAFDPKHMDHAVSALVSNAIEAAPDGGKVWVDARAIPGGQWELAVVDDGPGVSAEAMPRLFEPQFTTKRHGHGLGLAMAQQIVKGHAGKISVKNGDDRRPERRGACFVIRMPIHAVESVHKTE